jgi:translation initiation factor 2 subunit 1
MVTDPDLIFLEISRKNPEFIIDASVKRALLKDISRRMTPQPLKIRADVELTCFEGDGIENIKDAMRKAELVSTELCKIKVSLVASPLYVITTQTLEKERGIDLVEAAIQAAQVRNTQNCK